MEIRECDCGLRPMGFSTPTLHSHWIRIGVDPLRMEYDMFTKLVRMCAIGALSLAVLGPAAVAQGFDGKKFFDELSTRGVSTGTLDPERFFEELRATGASAQNRLDPEAFFKELQMRGASMPVNFDARRFFDELAATGASAPDIVDTKKK